MKSSAARYLTVLIVGAVAGAVVTLDMSVRAERNAKQAALAPLPIEELQTFTEVYNRIKTDYVLEADDKELINSAIEGMLAGLDPHSGYFDPTAFKEMMQDIKGKFGGLGIEILLDKSGFVKVIAPIEDTPAARAGIQSGDLIIRLDDKDVKGMSIVEAVRIMRGQPGTSITLTVAREGESKLLTFKLTRAEIKVQSVKSRLLDPGFGYVRIAQFQELTQEDLFKAVRKLETDNKGALKGLVLDLRNNPGGALDAAIGVSDAFLEQGKIVYTQGRIEGSKVEFSAKPGDLLNGMPIVVLINGGSASASEIVAGALQDHKRAVIMGTRSFGKASVQNVSQVSNGWGLKLTVARYYTPNGRLIQASGIEPDIVTEEAKITKTESTERTREADLARHLDGETGSTPKKEDKDSKTDPAARNLPGADDYQVQEALNLLKGISIVKGRGSN